MSKKSVQEGDIISVAAPYDVLSGGGFRVGSLVAIAQHDALNTTLVQGARTGVHTVKKLSTDVVTVGAKLNWNDSTKQFQLATSTVDGAATALAAAGNGVTEVLAVLTPV